jgi:hypothetical protein
MAFEVIWSVYDFSQVEDSYRAQFRKIFDYLIDYFIYTPIMLDNGDIWKKSHGVPSGSGFT